MSRDRPARHLEQAPARGPCGGTGARGDGGGGDACGGRRPDLGIRAWCFCVGCASAHHPTRTSAGAVCLGPRSRAGINPHPGRAHVPWTSANDGSQFVANSARCCKPLLGGPSTNQFATPASINHIGKHRIDSLGHAPQRITVEVYKIGIVDDEAITVL